MGSEISWTFAVDSEGLARVAEGAAMDVVAIETVQPGEYLVTLPIVMSRKFGIEARVSDDAGFVAAAPGDDAGNKPRAVRVLTLTDDHNFGPRPFTLVISTPL